MRDYQGRAQKDMDIDNHQNKILCIYVLAKGIGLRHWVLTKYLALYFDADWLKVQALNIGTA